MKKIKNLLFLTLTASVAACGTPPESRPSVALESTGRSLSATPDLSAYARIELYAQGANASTSPEQLLLQFVNGQAQFDVRRADGMPVGRLHVQPEDCRDALNAGCERRFAINGRLQALGVNLSCVVPVRNDSTVGYGLQTLSGLCQSQYGRAYTIQIFPR
jgi:hypothetical protein